MNIVTVLRTELHRALHRRLVWTLVGIAGLGIGIFGVVAFVDSSGRTVADLQSRGGHPALLHSWWRGAQDGVLLGTVLPLAIGALLGGASVAGAEWRAGTVATVLSWEPRRLRLHLARAASSFGLATLIAFYLECLLLGAALPAILAHGSTAGADGAWWISLVAAMVRIALLTGGVALLGVSLATVGRSTAFALGAAFAWLAVVEGLVRGLKPAWQRLLMGDNAAIAVTWRSPIDGSFRRPGAVAAATIALYLVTIAALAAISFCRRDVATTA